VLKTPRRGLCALLRLDSRERRKRARAAKSWGEKIVILLRLEPGSEQTQRYLGHCRDARGLHERRTRTGKRGRPKLAILRRTLIEVTAAIFRPITAYEDGTFGRT
jgi:hypothetical protein